MVKIKGHEYCCTKVSIFISCLYFSFGVFLKHLESTVELNAKRKEIQSDRFCAREKRTPGILFGSKICSGRSTGSSSAEPESSGLQASRGAAFGLP